LSCGLGASLCLEYLDMDIFWERGRVLGLNGSDWLFLVAGIALSGTITLLFSITS